MKKIKYLIIITVIIFAIRSIYTYASPKTTSDNNQEVTIVTPEKGEMKKTVSSSGKIVSNLDVIIKCKASGEIINLPVDISDPVKDKDLICELDPEDEKRNLRQARVKLESAKAKLAQSKVKYQRQKELLENNIARKKNDILSAEAELLDSNRDSARLKRLYKKQNTSLETVEDAELACIKSKSSLENNKAELEDLLSQQESLSVYEKDIILAQCDVESNQISVETVAERLEDTKIYTPLAGVVSSLNVQEGLIVSSSTSNVSGGTTLMTISDLSKLFVLADVDESDIGEVKLDQPVEITVDAFQNEKFNGQVVRIATMGTSTSNVVTFEVKIEVTGENKKLLLPEMTADIEIITDYAKEALRVPETAVVTQNGKSFVYVYDESLANDKKSKRKNNLKNTNPDNSTSDKIAEKTDKKRNKQNIPGHKRIVETGISDGINIQITSGIEQNEQIIDTPLKSSEKWVKKKKSLLDFGGSGKKSPIPGMGRVGRRG